MASYDLHLPEAATPGHCLATFSTTLTALALELGTYFDNQMRAKEGPHWFKNLCEYRNAIESNYHLYKSNLDISWVINEPYRHIDSPIREFLPKGEYQFYPTLKLLLDARNRWYHDHNPHNVVELTKVLGLAKYIADKCGLELAENLKPVIERVNAIKSGSYQGAIVEPSNEASANPQKLLRNPVRQSAVGASWLGPVGERKIQLTTAGSLIDLAAGENVSSEMVNLSTNRFYQLWRALGLDWLWVDANNSVAANVNGSLRMVGYWGAQEVEPQQDPFAKFLLVHTYTFTQGKLFDINSNQELDESGLGRVTLSTLTRGKSMVLEGEVLRLTWDGDLIYFGDTGPECLGEIESKDWFAGHFFVPTA